MSRIPARVFISYSHADKATAGRFARELEKRGAVVLFDQQTVELGDRLSERINEAIRSSDIFLLLVSPWSAESSWVHRELGAALAAENRTRVIPVRLADAEMPVDLSDILYLDANPDDLGSAAERVLRSSGPAKVGRRSQKLVIEEIEHELSSLDLSWQWEPSIAGVRPDILVETTDGKRLVVLR